jgi:hypothetical protein
MAVTYLDPQAEQSPFERRPSLYVEEKQVLPQYIAPPIDAYVKWAQTIEKRAADNKAALMKAQSVIQDTPVQEQIVVGYNADGSYRYALNRPDIEKWNALQKNYAETINNYIQNDPLALAGHGFDNVLQTLNSRYTPIIQQLKENSEVAKKNFEAVQRDKLKHGSQAQDIFQANRDYLEGRRSSLREAGLHEFVDLPDRVDKMVAGIKHVANSWATSGYRIEPVEGGRLLIKTQEGKDVTNVNDKKILDTLTGVWSDPVIRSQLTREYQAELDRKADNVAYDKDALMKPDGSMRTLDEYINMRLNKLVFGVSAKYRESNEKAHSNLDVHFLPDPGAGKREVITAFDSEDMSVGRAYKDLDALDNAEKGSLSSFISKLVEMRGGNPLSDAERSKFLVAFATGDPNTIMTTIKEIAPKGVSKQAIIDIFGKLAEERALIQAHRDHYNNYGNTEVLKRLRQDGHAEVAEAVENYVKDARSSEEVALRMLGITGKIKIGNRTIDASAFAPKELVTKLLNLNPKDPDIKALQQKFRIGTHTGLNNEFGSQLFSNAYEFLLKSKENLVPAHFLMNTVTDRQFASFLPKELSSHKSSIRKAGKMDEVFSVNPFGDSVLAPTLYKYEDAGNIRIKSNLINLTNLLTMTGQKNTDVLRQLERLKQSAEGATFKTFKANNTANPVTHSLIDAIREDKELKKDEPVNDPKITEVYRDSATGEYVVRYTAKVGSGSDATIKEGALYMSNRNQTVDKMFGINDELKARLRLLERAQKEIRAFGLTTPEGDLVSKNGVYFVKNHSDGSMKAISNREADALIKLWVENTHKATTKLGK